MLTNHVVHRSILLLCLSGIFLNPAPTYQVKPRSRARSKQRQGQVSHLAS
ncbi:hypothetical protein Hanom_Chr08g00736851 [Helianthus anomalus]